MFFSPPNIDAAKQQFTFTGPQYQDDSGADGAQGANNENAYPENEQRQHLQYTQKKKPQIDDAKFKTELCKNWVETGKCNYGRKCRFAHGKHELVEKSYIAKGYKSKECNTFHTQFTCPYGQRCMFIHECRSIPQIQQEYFYQTRLARLCEEATEGCQPRLSVFESLCSGEELRDFELDARILCDKTDVVNLKAFSMQNQAERSHNPRASDNKPKQGKLRPPKNKMRLNAENMNAFSQYVPKLTVPAMAHQNNNAVNSNGQN